MAGNPTEERVNIRRSLTVADGFSNPEALSNLLPDSLIHRQSSNDRLHVREHQH